jgi:DNA repair protein RecN (Recombination protein N)
MVLTALQIENVAVIQKAEIEFTSGFCVLTGETGAGKSILIDSLNAVLGNRASKDLVRRGSNKATVTAVFEQCTPYVLNLLEEMGFASDDDTVIFSRSITADGRSQCRINGCIANTATVRQLAVHLINIHGQQDNHNLLESTAHGAFVDKLLADSMLISKYREAYGEYKRLTEEYNRLQMDEADKARQVDMLTYQVEELTAANLQIGEYEQLSARKKTAANSEKIAHSLNNALAFLEGDDMQSGGADLVQSAAGYLSDCARYMSVDGLDERLQSIAYELDAVKDEIRSLTEETVFDPSELMEIEERLDVLYRLSRKYGENEEEMLAFLEKAQEKLNQLTLSDQTLKQLETQIASAKTKAEELAQALSDARHEAAEKLDRAVCGELQFLNMPNVTFLTQFTPCPLYSGGGEKMEFFISANPGEPPKPLSKVASGGELSRIMLAIISVLTRQDSVATLIFDEIDAGISGRAALKVGEKLKSTSQDHQVICITHLAQIAAKADSHYLIEKNVDGESAVTTVTRLTDENRIDELARIIGGEDVTKAAKETAKELMNL